jgi:hypothetical protein
VLGDLAIAYDSRSYRPSISPLVKACTESRMFDYFSPSDDTERSVLQAEYAITTSTAVNENERIHYLSSFCGCRDYRLWRALLNLGQRNYPQAILDFQYVLDQGIKHWRIYFYLGYAQIKAKQFNKAKGTLQMIKDDYLKNFDLLDSFYHLKSDPNFTNV